MQIKKNNPIERSTLQREIRWTILNLTIDNNNDNNNNNNNNDNNDNNCSQNSLSSSSLLSSSDPLFPFYFNNRKCQIIIETNTHFFRGCYLKGDLIYFSFRCNLIILI